MEFNSKYYLNLDKFKINLRNTLDEENSSIGSNPGSTMNKARARAEVEKEDSQSQIAAEMGRDIAAQAGRADREGAKEALRPGGILDTLMTKKKGILKTLIDKFKVGMKHRPIPLTAQTAGRQASAIRGGTIYNATGPAWMRSPGVRGIKPPIKGIIPRNQIEIIDPDDEEKKRTIYVSSPGIKYYDRRGITPITRQSQTRGTDKGTINNKDHSKPKISNISPPQN